MQWDSVGYSWKRQWGIVGKKERDSGGEWGTVGEWSNLATEGHPLGLPSPSPSSLREGISAVPHLPAHSPVTLAHRTLAVWCHEARGQMHSGDHSWYKNLSSLFHRHTYLSCSSVGDTVSLCHQQYDVSTDTWMGCGQIIHVYTCT